MKRWVANHPDPIARKLASCLAGRNTRSVTMVVCGQSRENDTLLRGKKTNLYASLYWAISVNNPPIEGESAGGGSRTGVDDRFSDKISGIMALLTTLLFTISCLLARPTLTQPRPVIIRQQAYQAVQASLQGDYSTLLTYTYPRLIQLAGGPEKMRTLMKQQGAPAPAQAIHIHIEQPGIIYPAGQELHVVVPYVLTILQKPNAVQFRAYQLAVSQNRGKHWYFVPTDQLTPARIRTLFPMFNPRLKIPPPSKPVGVKQASG